MQENSWQIYKFGGSSLNDSDCILKPVANFPDPDRRDAYLVMNEVYNADGTPHITNARATIDDDDNDCLLYTSPSPRD